MKLVIATTENGYLGTSLDPSVKDHAEVAQVICELQRIKDIFQKEYVKLTTKHLT